MTSPLYKPPTQVTSRSYPYLALVSQSDPSFQRYKHREVEYEMASGKRYVADPYIRGAYNRLSNTYPVGQPMSTVLDPLVQAALAPTVGNPVPGLYLAVTDGKGWA